jgi:two-component system sensor histidine kinase UhpB
MNMASASVDAKIVAGAVAALAPSEQGLDRSLLHAIHAAIIATDLDGTIIYWNHHAEDLYGWPAEEVLGRNIMQVVVAAEVEKQAADIMEHLRTGQSWTGEFHVLRKDGKQLAALVTDSPIFDENGAMVGIVGISQDMRPHQEVETARRKAQEELEQRVEQRTQELNAANQSLRDLSARLLQLQDDERRHIARELHDSVGQLLAAIAMNISLVKSESSRLSPHAARAVFENSTMIEQISGEIRTISHLLHPPLLDEAGLSSALRWYVDGFARRSKIGVQLNIAPDFERIPQETELAIFRVVQECLTNIHRHSGSASATISLTRQDERVWLEIKDNGNGIPPEKHAAMTTSGRSGVGLAGMRERVRQLGGILEIHSSRRGTVIKAGLPLAHQSVNPPSERVA